MYFWTYGPQKTWLGKFLKVHVSEDPSRGNMVNGLKKCTKLNDSTFIIFTDPCKGKSKAIQIEKVSLSNMQNDRTVC